MKKIIAMLLIATLTLSMLIGCSNGEGGSASGGNSNAISFTYPTYRVGAHMSAESEKVIVEAFNEKYKGKYYVEIEEIPSQQ